MVGREVSVLFEKPGRMPGQMVGKSEYLHAVHVQGLPTLTGRIAPVEIVESGPNSLVRRAEVTCVSTPSRTTASRIIRDIRHNLLRCACGLANIDVTLAPNPGSPFWRSPLCRKPPPRQSPSRLPICLSNCCLNFRQSLLIELCGEFDRNLAQIEHLLSVHILRRGNELALLGDARAEAAEVVQALYARLEAGKSIEPGDIDAAVRMGGENRGNRRARWRPDGDVRRRLA
jgi:hypothetical protein